MKKIWVLFLIFFAMCFRVQATQDTVHYGDSCYLFNPVNFNDCWYHFNVVQPIPYTCMIPYFPIPGQRIYGIAVTADDDSVVANFAPVTIGLYVLRGGHPVLVDTANLRRGVVKRHFLYECGLPHYMTYAADCFELMFGENHLMNNGDTILLAFADSTQLECKNINGIIDYQMPLKYNVDYSDSQPLYARHHGFILGFDGNYVSNIWGGFFPMLEPDHPWCEKPTGFHVAELGAGYVTLAWDGGECDNYTLHLYEPLDTDITVFDTFYTVTSLEAGIMYSATVSRTCHHMCSCHDTMLYSPMSTRRYFQVTANGIQDAVVQTLNISPNPASGTVTVDCDVADGTIEVVDMQGRTVLTAPSTQRTLDISRLAAGSYVVRLTTPQGTAVRRLQVE